MSKREDSNAYSRGYAAGRKRTDEEAAKWREINDAALLQHYARRDAIFCAALNALIINGNWLRGGAKAETSDDYIAMARNMADKSMAALHGA